MNQSRNEILGKIKSLEDKLWDAISYISSDYCKQCSYMYDQVRVYEQEIKQLKEHLENERH
jgi:hypothetical protein